MGICHACLSGRSDDDAEEQSVKVVRVTDGQLFEYPGPVYVKDLMYGFEGFAVFPYSTERQPLPPDAELKLSQLYYLRPWVHPEDAEATEESKVLGDESPGVSGKIGARHGENSVQRGLVRRKTVRFLDDKPQSLQQDVSSVPAATSPSSVRDRLPGIELLPKEQPSGVRVSPPGMELLPSEKNGVLRVKLFIPKKKLCDLISTADTANTLVEKIVVPLLSPKREGGLRNFESIPPTASWRPSLEHIPEDA